MPTDLVTIATTAVLSQFLGPGAKHLGEVALERGKQIGSKAVAYLAAVGREPQPVEPKLLLPLVQAASLETDEGLAEKWAALLANAADPAQKAEMKPVYEEILRQLTAAEAQLLHTLFADAKRHLYKDAGDRYKHLAYMKADITSAVLELESMRYLLMRERGDRISYDGDTMERKLSFDASIDSFLRQQIIILAKAQPLKEKASFGSDYEPDRKRAFFTSLGYDFMQAVTPPTP